jgi:endo-1,4-beta-xylanase
LAESDASIAGTDAPLGGTAGGGSDGSVSTGGAAGTLDAGSADSTAVPSRPLPKKFAGGGTTFLPSSGYEVRSDFLKYWNQISPQEEGKWGSLATIQWDYSTPGGTYQVEYHWTKFDVFYDFSRKNHIPLWETALVWPYGNPSLSTDGAPALIEDWFRQFCGRYPDTEFITVVETPSRIPIAVRNGLGGKGTTGYDWVVQAFVWARKYCPKAILVLTDYDIIEWDDANQTYLDMLAKVLAAGAPVDAIGATGSNTAGLANDKISKLIGKLVATGLPIYITEYAAKGDDAAQEAMLKEQFPLLWTNDQVKGITYYGWVLGTASMSGVNLVSSDGSPRPALSWLMSYLGR